MVMAGRGGLDWDFVGGCDAPRLPLLGRGVSPRFSCKPQSVYGDGSYREKIVDIDSDLRLM